MKILIIQKKFMGDILVSSVIFPLIKKKYPDAEISFLLEEKYSQILAENPYLDHLIFWNEKNFFEMIRKIRHQKFDIVIDLYSKTGTGFLTLFSGAKKRIGFFKKYTQFFYNFPVKRKQAKSKNTTTGIEHRLQMLEPLDIPFEEVFPKTYLSEEELHNARKILAENGLTENDNLIMISTFGSSEEKTYPLEYMMEVLNYINDFQPDAKMLCNYLPSQKELFLELYSKVSSSTQKAIIKNFDTKDLREFAAITNFCKCLIGNEGGATNLSKSLGIPTFTIFAPQIDPDGWSWSGNPKMDRFLHVKDFASEPLDYQKFEPTFLKEELREFLAKIF